KSVKWLQKVVLTNLHGANDTYAEEDNDVDSWMKTCARFLIHPDEVVTGQPVPISGVAQVGVSGLSKVQYWLNPQGMPLTAGDPYFTSAPWKDAQLLQPPDNWGGGISQGKMPPDTIGFDTQTGRPKVWPMRYAIAHWAILLKDIPTGTYDIRCRT